MNEYIVKKGWFKKDIYHFCRKCKIYLNKKYGQFNWYYMDNDYTKSQIPLSGNIISDLEDIKKFKKNYLKEISKWKAKEERRTKELLKKRQKEKKDLKLSIIKLLQKKLIKMPVSDIDAHLKHKDVAKLKKLCEEMYHSGEINRTGNYRYFVLTEEKKKSKPKKLTTPRSDKVDVKAELKKFKEMLDEGLIEQEDYDAKKKELLEL